MHTGIHIWVACLFKSVPQSFLSVFLLYKCEALWISKCDIGYTNKNWIKLNLDGHIIASKSENSVNSSKAAICSLCSIFCCKSHNNTRLVPLLGISIQFLFQQKFLYTVSCPFQGGDGQFVTRNLKIPTDMSLLLVGISNKFYVSIQELSLCTVC